MVRGAAAFVLLGGLACGVAMAQERPIVGQDPADAARGRGPTGWLQAPSPRGNNAPQQAAQGAGAGSGRARTEGGQAGPADIQAPPVPNPLPGPSGAAPGSPTR